MWPGQILKRFAGSELDCASAALAIGPSTTAKSILAAPARSAPLARLRAGPNRKRSGLVMAKGIAETRDEGACSGFQEAARKTAALGAPYSRFDGCVQ